MHRHLRNRYAPPLPPAMVAAVVRLGFGGCAGDGCHIPSSKLKVLSLGPANQPEHVKQAICNGLRYSRNVSTECVLFDFADRQLFAGSWTPGRLERPAEGRSDGGPTRASTG